VLLRRWPGPALYSE